MEIEADDFTTIAGLVINESGKVPRSGEHLTLRGLEVEVLEADERRIGRLRLKRATRERARNETTKLIDDCQVERFAAVISMRWREPSNCEACGESSLLRAGPMPAAGRCGAEG